ncbi:MAG: RDD family protein [Myxococcales bacterium]|nr:RDD family protein [Myxococcales bacterium]
MSGSQQLAMGDRRLLLETPENVPLVFELASAGSRILAIFIDFVLITVTVTLVVVITSALIGADALREEAGDGELLLDAVRTLAIFFIWNFYFIATELRWQGRTLGKRVVGLRVIARDGGPLSSGLVFARNLTRDLEMLLPLAAIVNPGVVGGDDSPVGLVLAWVWLGIMAFMPLFNRYRARVGDLLAGTLVVVAPKQRLLEDLVAEEQAARELARDENGLGFTQEQLDLYGIHELQILEDVLRRYPANIDHDLLETIAYKIRTKIGWEPPPGRRVEAYEFLRGFYAAQRGRLEHKLLFGKRQERKVR